MLVMAPVAGCPLKKAGFEFFHRAGQSILYFSCPHDVEVILID
ncbi:hypothetical protein AFE_1713 [Acidithiobacillus ferrooxidans ATCC 23270]|uniref:Uncharacterized protein n=1 Tax=Acidithiobacillus ferrooxidans (strain ATCC 23270 / DSM 14882 / CIP 104768 / NCIMB 8455) TaxID=243159 RepID=B7JB50_ACIF2|nr:hypothetical protein AFE_1713 [Acidithiobacillus ferrooxidans ATCC 23270]